MAAAATLQRKPQGEDAERTPQVSTATTAAIMPSRAIPLSDRSALIQKQSFVSSPDDTAEREADRVAAHVVSMPEPSAKASATAPTSVMRSPLIVQRRPAPIRRAPRQAASGGNVMQQVKAAASGGFALSKKTRAYLEPRFKADFSNVRLHTDGKAKELSNKVGARAFTFGRHIFFNEGQYNPDSKAGLELLAHELTHTIQQRETIQRKPMVHERTDPHVQRIFGALGDVVGGAIDAVGEFVGDVVQIVKDFVAEHADVLPGFKILCLVLGYNPINDAPSPGGGRAILKELSTFIPFGDTVYEALNNHGIIDKGGAFIDTQIANFKALASAIIGAISSFFGSLGPSDALSPLGAWNRLKSSFTPVFASMKTFASGLISGFIDLVREVILKPMARWAAANIPHWDLLMGVLGINPVSNDGESPTMQLIGAFMKLIGQEEVWENIKKGNAIGRAWAWFQTAMSGAKAMVSGIPGQVMATIRSFTIVDVLTVVGAASKILGLFASIGGQFISWAGGTVIELLKIVIDVVAPGVMVYIQRAAGAFQTIVRNPIGFVGNLVRAAMQGFRQFAANFLTHLQASLVGWLTGALGGTGVYIPQGLNLREILKFVLSVLGLTWANIRQKLVRATNETTVVALETGMDIVRTLVTEGPAAAWQKILETLTNLKQMAIDAIMDFVKQRVVQAAVTRLLSMLSPAGAFIQAVIAIYNTIMFFVERLRQIAQVAASFIDAIATIASGNIGPAANRVETTMAGLLTLVISFLARIAGLGRVADAITGLIARVRAPINTAIDRVVAWIVAQARRVGRFILQAGVPADPNARLRLAVRDARAIARRLGGRISQPLLETGLAVLRTRYSLASLSVSQRGSAWFARASINPTVNEQIAEAARPAGASSSEPVNVVKQSSALTLPDGEGHVVYAAVSNGAVTVTMASGVEAQMEFVLSRLQSICRRALSEQGAALAANPNKKQAIEDTATQLIDIINICRPAWTGAGSIFVEIRKISEGRVPPWDQRNHAQRQEAAREELRRYLSGISANLVRKAKLGFASLSELGHRSAYVDAGGTLKPQYRDVRRNFYRFGWTSAATSVANAQMSALRTRARAIDPTITSRPNPSRFYWSEDTTGTASVSGYIADATDVSNNGQPEYDHITPLGTRWISGSPAGNNTDHSTRQVDYQTGIQVISKRTNLSKSGPSFIPNVGPNFKGPNDP